MKKRLLYLRNKKNEKISHYLLHTTLPTCVCSIFLLLALTALFLNPHSSLYSNVINSNPSQFVLGTDETKNAANDILNYIWFGSPITIKLSDQAIKHMADVRSLFLSGQFLIILLGIGTLFILNSKNRRQKLKMILWASASAIFALIIAFLISLLFDFEKLFLIFHKLVFANNLWLFPNDDSLILFFPQYFFQTIFTQLTLGLLLALSSIVLFLWLKEKRERLLSSKPA